SLRGRLPTLVGVPSLGKPSLALTMWAIGDPQDFGKIVRYSARDLTRSMRVNVGFVGLGVMGQGIVPRLQAAGHTVTGWNRSKNKANALIAAGMRWGETPRAVAEASDVVLSMVTDGEAVRSIALGAEGIITGLKPGGIYADMSTIAPDT